MRNQYSGTKLYRPSNPGFRKLNYPGKTEFGISTDPRPQASWEFEGDPLKPLSTDPDDPNLTDPDNDGHPGVTVEISVGKFFKGEIYITRREIFSNYLTLNNNGTLTGYVVDRSEQFVVGASKKILNQESNSVQLPDKGLSPVLLVKVDPEIDTPEELMKIRDDIFPEEPEFSPGKKQK